MKYVIVCILSLAGLVVVFSGGDDRFPDYRYKMTIYVETTDGELAFSSVREVTHVRSSSDAILSRKPFHTEVLGEAVIMEMPNDKTVFALMSLPDNPDYAKHIAGAALNNSRTKFKSFDSNNWRPDNVYEAQKMAQVEGPKKLPSALFPFNPSSGYGPQPIQLWPFFVSFGDMNNPQTIEKISAKELGVKRITIEITNDDVTTGIETLLPWALSYSGQLVSGSSNHSLHRARLSKLTDEAISRGLRSK